VRLPLDVRLSYRVCNGQRRPIRITEDVYWMGVLGGLQVYDYALCWHFLSLDDPLRDVITWSHGRAWIVAAPLVTQQPTQLAVVCDPHPLHSGSHSRSRSTQGGVGAPLPLPLGTVCQSTYRGGDVFLQAPSFQTFLVHYADLVG
jgi:hypothetical protein